MAVLQTFEVACASHVTGLCATSRSSQIAHCVHLGIDDIASVAGVPATLPTAMTYDVSNPPPHTAACLTVCPIAVDTNHVRFSGGKYFRKRTSFVMMQSVPIASIVEDPDVSVRQLF